MKTKISLKTKLMLQSMLPMFLIIFVLNLNFSFETSILEFIKANLLLLISEIFILILILYSIFIIRDFKYFSSISGDLPHKVHEVTEEKEAGLSFFLTYVLPLSVYDLSDVKTFFSFFVVISLIFVLMSKTNLYYANPILCIIGYRVYRLKYKNDDSEKIVVSLDEIKDSVYITGKKISDNIILGKIKESINDK